jgi:putative two-component system hydrogenase maturation factor HypX/HoxX
MLLCSGFNGLSQRAWIELREAGHHVEVQLATDDEHVLAAVTAMDPDLVICPFLRERVPAQVWTVWPTVIVHPGPAGDRGPCSLDWALMDAEPRWGVTALQAVEEMDAGPIWGTRTFSVAHQRKSDLYNGPVTDAAVELIREVVAQAVDRSFVPEPLDERGQRLPGSLRPPVRQVDRAFCWSDPSHHILRMIQAADGSPGVRTQLRGLPVAAFDAHEDTTGAAPEGEPGTVTHRSHGAVRVATGNGAIWVGHLRCLLEPPGRRLKLPATTVLNGLLDGVPEVTEQHAGYDEITYRRDGAVGTLSFDFYNGAMSRLQCRRLYFALLHAAAQDTRVLLLRGGSRNRVFSNGIHLGVIEAAPDPAAEAWANIVAIDDVCRQIITCTKQLVVCAVAGNAGAGGVMLALGADRVLLRDGVVLNPHYGTMGLYGSEYWTYVLPRRVGQDVATALTTRCEPVGAAKARRAGLADEVLPADDGSFEDAVAHYAARLASSRHYRTILSRKRAARDADEHRRALDDYRRVELDRMWGDLIEDDHGFAAARRAFLYKTRVAPGITAARP